MPHAGWLKTMDVYSLSVLEAASLKLRSQQGQTLAEGSRRESVPGLCQLLVLLVVPGVAGLQLQPCRVGPGFVGGRFKREGWYLYI